MKVEAGKAGCAFEIVLDNDDGDFVVVENRGGNPTQTVRRGINIPQRLRDSPENRDKQHTLFEVVAKLRHAEARRDAEHERIRIKAIAEQNKVQTAKSMKERELYNNYWALDTKLRSADRRREELVRRIREKAQTTSFRMDVINKNNVDRRNEIDNKINSALVRAADNRNTIIRDLKSRLQRQSAHIERVRAAHHSTHGSRINDGYWQHDRKLTDAEKRREQHMQTIREKAGSPKEKIRAIKETEKVNTKVKTSRIEERMSSADMRRRENHLQIKAKASDRTKKVKCVNEWHTQRKLHMDVSAGEKHKRAIENRQKFLREVRSRQRARSLKCERVRQAKRAIVAAK